MRALALGSDAIVFVSRIWQTTCTAIRAGDEGFVIDSPVFPDELEALNAIVHPEVARLREEALGAAQERGDEIVVNDIPLLFENNLVDDFDLVVLVDAPRDLRLERLVRERALPAEDAMAMIAAQMPADLKRARADVVVDNEDSRAGLVLLRHHAGSPSEPPIAAWARWRRCATAAAGSGAPSPSTSPPPG